MLVLLMMMVMMMLLGTSPWCFFYIGFLVSSK